MNSWIDPLIVIPIIILIVIVLVAFIASTMYESAIDKAEKLLEEDRLITLATYDETTDTMSITYKSGRVAKFKGSGTVWYSYPMMERCHTRFEARLVDIKRYITEHGNPYPIAHEVA